MALKEQDIVFTTTDEAGNPVIQFPITRFFSSFSRIL